MRKYIICIGAFNGYSLHTSARAFEILLLDTKIMVISLLRITYVRCTQQQ